MWMSTVVVVAWCATVAAADGGPVGSGARFAATATVLLGDEAARGAEVGYRLRAALAVRPLWAEADDVLLHFTLESPQLMLRGKKLTAEFVPRASLWDSVPSSEFLALWRAGRINEAYLDPRDPPDILNFKKALISLFQYQVKEGVYNETDVSGECEVLYERVPHSETDIRKIKHRCLWEGGWDDADAPPEEEARGADAAGSLERRRVLRLALAGAGRLRAARHDELALLRGAGAGALTARALLELAHAADLPRAPRAASLRAARAAHAALQPHALPLRAQDQVPDEPEEEESLESGVAAAAAALAGRAAGSAAAAAALRLLPALRRAPAARLRPLLRRAAGPQLPGLARLLGLAGAAGAHAAAHEAFALDAPARPELAREYLAALALAPAADAAVVRAALALAGAGGALAADALLAAAAAAAAHPDPGLQLLVKDDLVKGLARCKDDECRAERLQALGQLRRADCAELLLQHAARAAPRPALAALGALAALEPRAALAGDRLRRLERLALALDGERPLEVRSAALELLLAAAAPPWEPLRRAARALRAHGPRELRRLHWLRLRRRAADDAALAAALPALDPRPASWLAHAFDGTSSLLARGVRWARLEAAQLAAGGALRRGGVRLAARARPLLHVGLWAQGLRALAGAAPAPEDAPDDGDEELQAGLELAVAGARRRDVRLFAGQAELLAHVWAGTGSAPTPALRALLARPAWRRALPLVAGALLAADADAAAALALDAHAAASLWARSARGGLRLRGGGAERLALRLRAAWGRAAARARAALQPALRLAAALDFYGAPRLCVRVRADDDTYRRNVTLESEFGATRWRVRRERASTLAAPGCTLALGAPNDAACRALGDDDDDDDDDESRDDGDHGD